MVIQPIGVKNVVVNSMSLANSGMDIVVHYTVSTVNKAITPMDVISALTSSSNMNSMTSFLDYYFQSVTGASVPAIVNLSPTASPTVVPSYVAGAPTPTPTTETLAIIEATYVSEKEKVIDYFTVNTLYICTFF